MLDPSMMKSCRPGTLGRNLAANGIGEHCPFVCVEGRGWRHGNPLPENQYIEHKRAPEMTLI